MDEPEPALYAGTLKLRVDGVDQPIEVAGIDTAAVIRNEFQNLIVEDPFRWKYTPDPCKVHNL